MAVRVHVLRTCDRCGRPIETNGTVPVQQLKEGDVIPTFHRTVLCVTREEPAMDGGVPTRKVLGTFTDICDTCSNVIERALDTLLKRAGEDEEPAAGADGGGEPKRKTRAGRAPRANAPDLPGPHGPMPTATTGSEAGAGATTAANPDASVGAEGAPATPDTEGSTAAAPGAVAAPETSEGSSHDEPF